MTTQVKSEPAAQVPPNVADEKKPETKVDETKVDEKKPETKPETKVDETKAGETKVDEKKPETKVDEKKPETKPGETKAGDVPALKAEDLQLPEGSLLRERDVAEVLALAAEKKLPKAEAQALLQQRHELVGSYMAHEAVLLKERQEGWYTAAKADKELGGEAYDQNVELGFRFLKRFGNPTVEKLLKETGMYEHPEILRMIVRAAKATADDKWIDPEAGTHEQKPESRAKRIYGEDGTGRKPATAAA
jgi:hypothetical protein